MISNKSGDFFNRDILIIGKRHLFNIIDIYRLTISRTVDCDVHFFNQIRQ